MSNPQIGERSIRRLIERWKEVRDFISRHRGFREDPVKNAQYEAFNQCIQGARDVLYRAQVRRKRK